VERHVYPHFGTKTNRHPDNSTPQLDKSAPQKDKSALVCFSLILRTKLTIALNQFQILIMSVPEKIYAHFQKNCLRIAVFHSPQLVPLAHVLSDVSLNNAAI
jgi:hypothetical protein